jgi:hypothetical protein
VRTPKLQGMTGPRHGPVRGTHTER